MIVFQKDNLAAVQTSLAETFGDKLLKVESKELYLQLTVDGSEAKAILRHLKNTPTLAFSYFIDITAIDFLKYPERPPERYAVTYVLLSPSLGIKILVKAWVSDQDPRIATVTDLWQGANWTEREAYDLFGIEFTGHPNLKRILMPDDYDGHPLRKDYPLRGRGERGNFPVYHGIPAEKAPPQD